jgi:hypothetical protein
MDLAGSVQLTALYPVDARDETVVAGEAVDVAPLEGDLVVLLDAEAGTGTTPTLNLAIQHRADASDSWGAVPADALYDPATGQVATFDEVTDVANAFQKLALRRERLKKTLRAVLTIGGTTPDFVCAVYLVGLPKYGPGW